MTRVLPDDLASSAKAALAEADPTRKWQQLRDLSVHRELSYLQTLQLDKALQRAAGESAPPLPACRLAVLSSCTCDHLLPAIRVAGFRRGLWVETFKGEYGLYRQEILQPSPALAAFQPDFVLLSISPREVLSVLPASATAQQVNATISAELEQLRSLWRRIRESLGATVIQQSYLDVSRPLFGNYDRLAPASPVRILHELNHQLLDAVAGEGVALLDVAQESTREGTQKWFDLNRWLQGKLEISPEASGTYGRMVAQSLGAHKGLSKKCLVLDLDNTLWGGVIGDDGLEGIVLGEGSARGEAHLHLQRYARQLKERGIILAVCSKNEESIARTAFEKHPEMLLSLDDVAAFVANWNDKSANLRAIAEQLNIGLDSLVFLDDNPAERARIRESLPQVAVPELTDDPAGYVDALAREGYFDAITFTAEDLERTRQYAANARRAALQSNVQSMAEFLSGLEMTMTVGRVGREEQARAVQLINKTNQFNTTGRRYQPEELAALLADDAHAVWYFRLADRFGDNGLVSVLLASRSAEGGALEIDNWVMSCRVFGRQFEHAIMNQVVEYARRCGVREIRAVFRPTEKNGVISQLFENLGYVAIEQAPAASRWRLSVDDYAPLQTHIKQEGSLGSE